MAKTCTEPRTTTYAQSPASPSRKMSAVVGKRTTWQTSASARRSSASRPLNGSSRLRNSSRSDAIMTQGCAPAGCASFLRAWPPPSAPAMRRDLTSETGCASYGYERDTGDRTGPQRDNLTLSWLREEAARRYLSQRTHVLKSPHLHRPRRRDGGRREGPAGPVG